MSKKRALIVGCGYVGREAAHQLLAAGWNVTGITRSGQVPDGIESLATDVTANTTELPRADLIVYGISPSGRDAAAYQAAYVDGAQCALQARASATTPFVLLSSTGIYGTADGSWVTEETDPQPQTETGKVLESAESAVLSSGGSVLRLGGIYGPNRTGGLTRSLNGGTRFINRIHRDDAAAAAVYLATQCWSQAAGQVYLGVDSLPATADQIREWLSQQIPVEQLPTATPSTRPPRHGSHKRCDNTRLVNTGFHLSYPSYREGYASLLTEWLKE